VRRHVPLYVLDQYLRRREGEPEGCVPPTWFINQDDPKSLAAGTIKGSQVIEGMAVEDDQVEGVEARQLVQHGPVDLAITGIGFSKLGRESLDAAT